MKRSSRAKQEVAAIMNIPLTTAAAFIYEVQGHCVHMPTADEVAQACREIGRKKCNSVFTVAVRASEIHGLTKFNVKNLPDHLKGPPSRRPQTARQIRRKQDAKWGAARLIADLHKTDIEDAASYMETIRRLCKRPPSYEAIAKVCISLRSHSQTTMEIAEAASEFEGFKDNLRTSRHVTEKSVTEGQERCAAGTYPTNKAFTEGADDPDSDWSIASWEVD